jgi:hypothetical protein
VVCLTVVVDVIVVWRWVQQGYFPLYEAAMQNKLEWAKYLLENGADPNIRTKVSTATCGLVLMLVVVGSVE